MGCRCSIPIAPRLVTGPGLAATPLHDTSCSCCNTTTEGYMPLVQHPHSPSSGNGAGFGCNALQLRSCSKKRVADAAAAPP